MGSVTQTVNKMNMPTNIAIGMNELSGGGHLHYITSQVLQSQGYSTSSAVNGIHLGTVFLKVSYCLSHGINRV